MEDNLTSISNAMFRYRKQWINVTDDLKEKWFFIINRYLSKIYPEQAFLLNEKSVDKIAGMNTWYAFMLDKPYPNTMWSKQQKSSKKEGLPQKDIDLIQEHFGLRKEEMELLIKYHLNDLKEDIKYLKSQSETN